MYHSRGWGGGVGNRRGYACVGTEVGGKSLPFSQFCCESLKSALKNSR